jgi:hypothetical protein
MVNTDQRVVIAFMQIPGRADHALVIPTDNLPGQLEHVLMQILESPEGQSAGDLASVLNRRMMPNDTTSVLQAFHEQGLMAAVPIDNVMMFPTAAQGFPLRGILEQMGRLEKNESSKPLESKYNPHTANQQVASAEGKAGIANNLLIEAEMLEATARQKRDQAYSLAPNLRKTGDTVANLLGSTANEGLVAATAETASAPKTTRTTAKRPTAKK